MDLKDAKAQVEREHPELTGTAKVRAIKQLRDAGQPIAGDARPAGGTKPGEGLPQCSRCEQYVRPKTPDGWPRLLAFVALSQLAAVVVAVVRLFHAVHADTGGPVARLVFWPAAVHPGWLAVLAAVAALVLASGAAGAARERARRRAVCPHCEAPMTASQRPE